MGLFTTSHMEFNYKVNGVSDKIPTLTEMTMKAIEILSQNPKGFFLFVEGGLIDPALHEVKPHIALDETLEFSRAIDVATKMVNLDETLIVATADHTHTMTISGYGVSYCSLDGLLTPVQMYFHMSLSFSQLGPRIEYLRGQ